MAITINEEALKQLGKRVGGGGPFLDASKLLTPNAHVRVIMGHPNMDGVPFFIEEGYWINKKRYVSPKTFGLPCPIEEEIEAAIEKDPRIKSVLEDGRLFSNKPTTMCNVVVLQVDDKYNITGVVDDSVKVLQMGKQLFGAMYGIITGTPQVTPGEILSPDKGYNMELTKTGTGMNTQYSAKIWMKPTEVDAKFYTLENIPDIVEITRKKMKTNDELRQVIRDFLYGGTNTEEKPEEISVPTGGGKSLLDAINKK